MKCVKQYEIRIILFVIVLVYWLKGRESVLDYQMQKTMGKCFRSKGSSITGIIRILGSWYDYKVVNGTPEPEDMLEVIDFTSRELLVVINNNLKESDVNYIVNI